MGKGKGRQSRGFTHKGLRAAQNYELRQEIEQSTSSSKNRRMQSVQQQQRERPRLAGSFSSQLRGWIRERQCQENFELMQRRRRNGFVPGPNTEDVGGAAAGDNKNKSEETLSSSSHPAGWILNYPSKPKEDEDDDEDRDEFEVPTLQSLSLTTFARHIYDYIDAVGRDGLHNLVSLLPSDVLSQLSIMLSSPSPISTCNDDYSSNNATRRRSESKSLCQAEARFGINNDLAVVLGKHPHIECLCFRAATVPPHRAEAVSKTLTDDGLRELIPRTPKLDEIDESKTIVDDWDDGADSDDDDDTINDNNNYRRLMGMIQVEGCNLRLRRLELLDCQDLSATVVLELFERCCGITHLSLAGSFNRRESHGIEILKALPSTLPYLQVLDVSRCPTWATPTLVAQIIENYREMRTPCNIPTPIVFCVGGGQKTGKLMPIYNEEQMKDTDPW